MTLRGTIFSARGTNHDFKGTKKLAYVEQNTTTRGTNSYRPWNKSRLREEESFSICGTNHDFKGTKFLAFMEQI
jgi:hypothetical protein